MGEIWKNFEAQGRKILHHLNQTVGKTMDIQVPSGEGSEEEKYAKENPM